MTPHQSGIISEMILYILFNCWNNCWNFLPASSTSYAACKQSCNWNSSNPRNVNLHMYYTYVCMYICMLAGALIKQKAVQAGNSCPNYSGVHLVRINNKSIHFIENNWKAFILFYFTLLYFMFCSLNLALYKDDVYFMKSLCTVWQLSVYWHMMALNRVHLPERFSCYITLTVIQKTVDVYTKKDRTVCRQKQALIGASYEYITYTCSICINKPYICMFNNHLKMNLLLS